MITAMILAGGTGSRVGADRPKQFVEILGKPVLGYTIEIYQNHPLVDAIEVVCHKDWKQYLEEMVEKYHYKKVKWITDGGETFQDSCINGINYLKNHLQDDDYLMIHYGAAPFTSEKIVSDVIRVMKEKNSAITATPVYQLLASNDDNGESKTYYDRDKFIQIACPYGFKFSYIVDIYARAKEQGLLEVIEPHTTSLMYALKETLYQAYGDQTNIKITTKEDLDLFEGYVLMKQKRENQQCEKKF
ncbi:MAG: IspD/TarI family cytidylyltransferase [Bacillota bacterium]|nr:IspD/TarI family cytidylyltransferase [Bacillota bacterium]